MYPYFMNHASSTVKKMTLEPSVPDVSLLLDKSQMPALKSRTETLRQVENFHDKNNQKEVRFQLIPNDDQLAPNNIDKGKQFQQLYLGNIPTSQLDLSLVNTEQSNKHSKEYLPKEKSEPKPKRIPTTYKEFLKLRHEYEGDESKKQECTVMDIYNYNSPKTITNNERVTEKPVTLFPQHINNENITTKLVNSNSDFKRLIPSSPHIPNQLFTETKCEVKKQDCSVQTESTTTELTKNEPSTKDLLQIIQKQNEQILILQRQVANLLESKKRQEEIEYPKQKFRPIEDDGILNNRRKLGGAGVRPPLSKFSIDLMTSFEVSFRPQRNHRKDFPVQESKIRDISEIDDNAMSLQLQQPITVSDGCPSPDPSIRIDMNEFETSDNEEDEGESLDTEDSFYKNLMDQMNKLLKNSEKDDREATMQHLRKLSDSILPKRNDDNLSEKQAFKKMAHAIQQILMKQLPGEEFAKAPPPAEPMKAVNCPQFSFASVQYMKKYNLLDNDSKITNKMTKQILTQNLVQKEDQDRILNITSLKQQTKLI